MGFGSLIKRAFSGVREWDRRNMYGSDYKEKAAALAQLNELNVKAKLLENQDKFERIQQMRAEMAQRNADRENQQVGAAFEGAVKLGSSLDPTPIPGFVSPVNPNVSADEVDPTNILHSPGEGTIEPELPSHIKSRLRPEDQGVLGMAIRTGRERRKLLESQQNRLFDANIGTKELQDDATQALINQRNAAADKARGLTGGGGGGGVPANDDDVSLLLNGGTADKISMKTRSAAVAAARAQGGMDGTGFVPMNGLQQNKYLDMRDLFTKVSRLGVLLDDPEVASKLGPGKGSVIGFAKEWPGVGQSTKVKEAFDLMKDLSDAELRNRSGAAISPGEYNRIVGFTIDWTKQADSNKTNLKRMYSTLSEILRSYGATNLSARRGVPKQAPAQAAPDAGGLPAGWEIGPDGVARRKQ